MAKQRAKRPTNPDRSHWTLRKVTAPEEQQQETYRYWASRPISERLDAIAELSQAAYSIKLDQDELALRRYAVDNAIGTLRIEGMELDPEEREIMERYARGEIDLAQQDALMDAQMVAYLETIGGRTHKKPRRTDRCQKPKPKR